MGHSRQLLMPAVEYVPEGQAENEPPLQLTPAGHCVQVVEPCTEEEEYEPVGQF